MGAIYLNKEIKGVLDVLKERYGDLNITKVLEKVWNDDDFKQMRLSQTLIHGKRAVIILKSEGIGGLFKWGKKL